LSAEVVTAGATVALAILAFASAVYAKRLWLEARAQFSELKRSTDMDIALRMLQRCDQRDLIIAEQLIEESGLSGQPVGGLAVLRWLKEMPDVERERLEKATNVVLHAYEHIGIVVRTSPAVEKILADYLCLRAPVMFDCLKPIISIDRLRSKIVHAEFEEFVAVCREVAKSKSPGAGA